MELNNETLKELDKTVKIVNDFPKPGIVFRDIAPIFHNPTLCTKVVDEMASRLANVQLDAVAGLEARGFLLGLQLAIKLNKPFIMVRKAGKLPGATVKKQYGLEYGSATIEIQEGTIKPGDKVLIHDDLLATGGTAGACADLIKECGGTVAGFMFIIELKDLNGTEKIKSHSDHITSLLSY